MQATRRQVGREVTSMPCGRARDRRRCGQSERRADLRRPERRHPSPPTAVFSDSLIPASNGIGHRARGRSVLPLPPWFDDERVPEGLEELPSLRPLEC